MIKWDAETELNKYALTEQVVNHAITGNYHWSRAAERAKNQQQHGFMDIGVAMGWIKLDNCNNLIPKYVVKTRRKAAMWTRNPATMEHLTLINVPCDSITGAGIDPVLLRVLISSWKHFVWSAPQVESRVEIAFRS